MNKFFSAMSSPKPPRKKRKVLSIEDKLKVCDMVKQKVPRHIIMDTFNITRRTITGIANKESQLQEFKAGKAERGNLKVLKETKTLREGSHAQLDQALYIWFRQKRELGIPVTGPLLLEQAKFFFSQIYPSEGEFKASTGFQWRFCKRFGINSLAIFGEKNSSDKAAANEFVEKFKLITKGYSEDQLFNADETGLYFRMLPQRTLASIHNEPFGTKKARERVTINACSNASGSIKLPLLMIGKSKKPRCFKNIDQKTLPVVYRHQKNAWVNVQIYEEWFQECFVPEVRKRLADLGQEQKAILFLDNCSAHPPEDILVSDDGKIVSKFFPANVTALIQPMDQSVLEKVKRNYRKRILRKLLQKGDDLIKHLKQIDLLEVVNNIADAWDHVDSSTLRASWNKLLPNVNDSSAHTPGFKDFVDDFNELHIEVSEDDVAAWFNEDGPGYEHLHDQGIVDLIINPPAADDSDDECVLAEEDNPSTSHSSEHLKTWQR